MSFCPHCEGQRFDRARVLRALRAERTRLQRSGAMCGPEETIKLAIEAVRGLDVPHLEEPDDVADGEVVH
jgi:hypothetical protein